MPPVICGTGRLLPASLKQLPLEYCAEQSRQKQQPFRTLLALLYSGINPTHQAATRNAMAPPWLPMGQEIRACLHELQTLA